ncbi:Phosphoglucosamine mutase [Sporomusa ovata DSM 2662]|uniref:Phosphoglucosamine mutase n=1 Tax=Sporomusa ovata TaxID=2378 RepID=A0A0U1KWL2_9FIRM|nr:phosphoglucosamine mutase [Sporomusa ovata]EQB28186.1 phosphoglucosamine mutase [Sporomusa ovata DSM 2662]CQR71716.1 Phosphoglucosamine mutase [Sporomusa ovata]
MARLFGTDGVRGLANAELTPDLAFKMGRAATCYFGKEHQCPVFYIGRDTRISGHMLEAALAAGICSAGGEAVLLGVIPTPAVAYLTKQHGAQAGVVISASHNPYPDNGIKFFAGTGYKLPDAVEDELEKLIKAEPDTMPRPTAGGVGFITYKHNLYQEYVDYALKAVDGSLSGLKIVIDCANGASYEAAPAAFRKLGAEVIVINDKPDGSNINAGCGSTHLEQLQAAVVQNKADIGLAHDGDADRCLAVDETGEAVDGDQIMLICALEMLRQNTLPDKTLVATVMSNLGLHQAMKNAGGKVLVTPVGDRYVLEAMLKHKLVLGGEQSGHIIFSQYSTTGDGLITSLKLAAALKQSGKKMSQLAQVMTRFPQLLENIRVTSKQGWENNAKIAAAIQAGEQELGDNGRILVRPSGTEPLIRVMAEGPVLPDLERIVTTIAAVIKQEQS